MTRYATVFRHIARALSTRALLPALLLSGYGPPLVAATLPQELIDVTQGFLEQATSDYLQRSEIPARHEVSVNRLDPRLRLADCDVPLQAELESPAQPVGRVTVRVSCNGQSPWTVFVPGQVRLYRDVIVASRPLKRGVALSAADVALVEHDVGLLTQGYLTDIAHIEGKKVTRATLPHQVLTPAHLELADAINKGEQVVITAQAGAISVKMPGEALGSGAPGQQIRVRNLSSGRVVKARVAGPGQVEVAM